MKTIIGDLWDQIGWKVIPTNLTVRGEKAVMGLGVAGQAASAIPHLTQEYGLWIKKDGWKIKKNPQAYPLYFFPANRLIMFPTKYYPNDKSSVDLIRRGVQCLSALDTDNFPQVYIPLLGCGYGELKEEEVKAFLGEHLDDHFILVLRDETVTKKYKQYLRPAQIRKDSSKINDNPQPQ